MNSTARDEGAPIQTRSHIYEIDLIRAITVFSVVSLHSIASTQFLLADQQSLYIVNLAIHLVHYNREMFMFLTGLVLTYAYFGKPFSAKKFWLRRTLLIFIPYLFWSMVYVWINNRNQDWLSYFSLLGRDVLTGQASYQLYYILLALQFYLIFPFFLLFLRKVARHPWTTLSISLVAEMIFMYVDYSYIQTGTLNSAIFTQFIVPYQERIFLTYQFFFIFGAFTAIYMKKGYDFLNRYGRLLPGVLTGVIFFYSLYYFHVLGLRQNIFYATSVIQPAVVVYSLVIIIFFFWLATKWVKKLPFYQLVKVISDTSFGIYFVHVFIIALVIEYLLPPLEKSLPVAVQMGFVVTFAFAASVAFCFLILQIPVLSWTIGRGRKLSQPMRQKSSKFLVLFSAAAITLGAALLIYSHQAISYLYTRTARTETSMVPADSFKIHSYPTNIVVGEPVVSSGCNVPLTITTGKTSFMQVESDHQNRRFLIYLPPEYNNLTAHPLVLAFHGYNDTPFNLERFSQFDNLATVDNVIVVYPEGSKNLSGVRGWNTTLHPAIRSNDVLFVSNMLNTLQSNLCIDKNQIYATGFSNGGGFVAELACKMPDRIAAFAPVSGSYMQIFNSCSANRPVSIMEFHGSADTTVPYLGLPSLREVAAYNWINDWAKMDGCSPKPVVTVQSKIITKYTWTGCRGNAAVVHYKIIGGRHLWPSALFARNAGNKVNYLNTEQTIWDFFKQHPL